MRAGSTGQEHMNLKVLLLHTPMPIFKHLLGCSCSGAGERSSPGSVQLPSSQLLLLLLLLLLLPLWQHSMA